MVPRNGTPEYMIGERVLFSVQLEQLEFDYRLWSSVFLIACYQSCTCNSSNVARQSFGTIIVCILVGMNIPNACCSSARVCARARACECVRACARVCLFVWFAHLSTRTKSIATSTKRSGLISQTDAVCNWTSGVVSGNRNGLETSYALSLLYVQIVCP